MAGPKVITSAYDFIKWLIPHIGKFPRNQRYTLGERFENKLFGLLELLIEAQYSKDKIDVLKKANLEIEQMRSCSAYVIHADSFNLRRRLLAEFDLLYEG